VPASSPNRGTAREAGPLGLSRVRIADAALDLIDREGLEAVSMRRLAQELGTGTMTIYGYFAGKDELLDAVVDVAAERHGAAPSAGSWRERLAEVIRSFRRGLAAHPGLIRLRLRRPLVSAGAKRGTEVGLQALREAGFDSEQATALFRVLFLYAFGFAAFSADEVSDELRSEVGAALNRLPPDEYPQVVNSAEHLVETLGGDDQFEFGLALILDGIEARRGESP